MHIIVISQNNNLEKNIGKSNYKISIVIIALITNAKF
jgi:hypothetical protein